MMFRKSIAGFKISNALALMVLKYAHTYTTFRIKTYSYSCKGNMQLGSTNGLVHDSSQLVISAWLHSSASYKQTTALPEHTYAEDILTEMETHTEVRNSFYEMLQRKHGLSRKNEMHEIR